MLDRLIPPRREHDLKRLQATLHGPARTVPISDGQLTLGTWHQILPLESDIKPRHRVVVATVSGE